MTFLNRAPNAACETFLEMGFWQHMVYAGRRALRTRERHLESILETIPDAMIVIDGYGIMQWMRLSEECSLRSKSMIDDGFAGASPSAGRGALSSSP